MKSTNFLYLAFLLLFSSFGLAEEYEACYGSFIVRLNTETNRATIESIGIWGVSVSDVKKDPLPPPISFWPSDKDGGDFPNKGMVVELDLPPEHWFYLYEHLKPISREDIEEKGKSLKAGLATMPDADNFDSFRAFLQSEQDGYQRLMLFVKKVQEKPALKLNSDGFCAFAAASGSGGHPFVQKFLVARVESVEELIKIIERNAVGKNLHLQQEIIVAGLESLDPAQLESSSIERLLMLVGARSNAFEKIVETVVMKKRRLSFDEVAAIIQIQDHFWTKINLVSLLLPAIHPVSVESLVRAMKLFEGVLHHREGHIKQATQLIKDYDLLPNFSERAIKRFLKIAYSKPVYDEEKILKQMKVAPRSKREFSRNHASPSSDLTQSTTTPLLEALTAVKGDEARRLEIVKSSPISAISLEDLMVVMNCFHFFDLKFEAFKTIWSGLTQQAQHDLAGPSDLRDRKLESALKFANRVQVLFVVIDPETTNEERLSRLTKIENNHPGTLEEFEERRCWAEQSLGWDNFSHLSSMFGEKKRAVEDLVYGETSVRTPFVPANEPTWSSSSSSQP